MKGFPATAALMVLMLGVSLFAAAGVQNSGSAASPNAPSSSSAGAGNGADSPMRSAQRELVKEEREASGEGDETAQFKYSPSVRGIAKLTGLNLEQAYWLCVVLNFAVIAGLIAWAWKKNVPAMFRNRTAAIQKAMHDARAASEDARQRLAQVEARLAKLDSEIAQLTANAEREVAAEEERIKAAAAEDGRKIVQTVEQEIAAAAKNARRELTAYAADLAVGLAGKQLRVDAATDQGLVSDFTRQLTGNGGSRKDGSA
jgi:F-type H+-transporting ATPase subunit b